MRFRTLEIRWHDSKPISTCDFQPVPFKKARPPAGQEKNFAAHSYRLATGGEDNHVRIWMVHPYIRPSSVVAESAGELGNNNVSRPPRVEYLATLSRHSAAVNVVRFSPNGEFIASAGDDGMIIIWAPSASPQTATYGSDLSAEDLQHEKEYWKPRITFRCTTMQVYDLAWSPTGEYILAGSTDNTARVFQAADGKAVCEIAEHTHYVQGVAWDPLNEYIATQSSDRSMHIYRISTKNGTFEAHAVGKNTRMPHRHSRTPSHSRSGRPRLFRSESTTSDAESVTMSDLPGVFKDEGTPSGQKQDATPLTPASVTSTPSLMFPPPPVVDKAPSSRRSSFSSNAPGSPLIAPNTPSSSAHGGGGGNTRYGRSPSPMPPLPAIRNLPSSWNQVKLYGDESWTNFFRRLTFSPDGGLLMTPAGQFEDPSNILGLKIGNGSGAKPEEVSTPVRGRKGRPSVTIDLTSPTAAGAGAGAAGSSSTGGASTTTAAGSSSSSSSSSVYIYSRANFARPPIAQLPGHKKASVAVKFSPVLYELRQGVEGAGHHPQQHETKHTAALERGMEGMMNVDIVGPTSSASSALQQHPTPQQQPIAAPAPVMPDSPGLSPMDLRPPTPAASKPPTPVPGTSQANTQGHHSHTPSSGSNSGSGAGAGGTVTTGSVFALPYRMLYGVVTMDTVAIYDTQQAGPVCLLTKLHYDEFTDMSWSPDGQCLMLSSRDGYCTLIIFDEILPAHHTQQHALQLQSIANHLSIPITYTSSSSSGASAAPAGTTTTTHAHPVPHTHNHVHPHPSHPQTPSSGSGSGSSASATSTTTAMNVTPTVTPSMGNVGLPPFAMTPSTVPKKRKDDNQHHQPQPPLTPAASVDGDYHAGAGSAGVAGIVGESSAAGAGEGSGVQEVNKGAKKEQEPPKKKRRVALTRVGDLGS
ncbi:hypothetical protein AX16_007152 [Volvariella volvacea WC 439]|nr:hypothetical protein AX16_007152 [Volvariella volvacea WC 439]